jgi:uncharacterized membrane protein (GlpM family)
MMDYFFKFIIGGIMLVLASYFSKSKNLFLAGVITTLPIMTLANMTLQVKFLNGLEFQQAQRNGIFGALGLVLFILSCYVLSSWFKPMYAILLSIPIYFIYFLIYKQLS